MDLFNQNLSEKKAPLADRMRPTNLDEFVGQDDLVGQGKILKKMIESDQLFSIIFWGPPGCGKTTLARIIAHATKSNFIQLSATSSGIADIRKVVEQAKMQLKAYQKKTILFIDELHRFNKNQQDTFLPYVEDGTFILIGATTENPSFEIISPLLSRSRILVLKSLSKEEIKAIINRALKDEEKGLGKMKIKIDDGAIDFLANSSNGDARTSLNALEIAIGIVEDNKKGEKEITKEIIGEALQHKNLMYDWAGEEHYNVVSAFIKSMRGSDPDAALYWLARMIEGGEDPEFIARRMVIFASEDISNADPMALVIAVSAFQAVQFVGLPEAQINLAHAATYLASAPKSNASYMGLLAAKEDVRKTMNLPVPLHLRNAVTSLMKNLGYGEGYKYPHDHPNEKMEYLPQELKGKKYYRK